MISKEEREEWRKMAEYRAEHSINPTPRQVIQLLDALEQAEAERDFLAKTLADDEFCPVAFGSLCEGCSGTKKFIDCWKEYAKEQTQNKTEE